MTVMEEVKTTSAQEKWATASLVERQKMLAMIGESSYFATFSWKKLSHIVRVNLSNKTWTA